MFDLLYICALKRCKFCQIVHIDLFVTFYLSLFLFFVFFFGLFVCFFQTTTSAIANNSSYGFVFGSGNVIGVKVSQKETF